MGKRLNEWVTNVLEGKTNSPSEDELKGDFVQAKYTGPPVRVKRAMIVYVETRNKARWRRLKADYAWLEKTLEEMGLNPKDARFLL